MDWATRRRTKYFIVLAVFAIVSMAFFLYPFFNRPATCFDNKKNGAEAGIDCGGSCQYLCGSQVSEPEVVWTRALPSANKRVALVTYLKNQNKTAGVAVAPYKFTAYDGSGKVIAIREGETQIPANGNIAIFVGPIDVGERKVQSTLFEWTKPLYFSSLTDKALASNLETVNTKLDVASTTTNLAVTLKNTTRLEYNKVPVVAILYDKDDNALLASRTVLDNLQQESSADIFFSWNVVPGNPVTTIEVLPYFEEFEDTQK